LEEFYKKDESLRKEIGRRFRVFRIFIKKDHKELAEELGVSKSTISFIETGKIFPIIPFQNYLNRKYHLNLNWLLSGSEEMIIKPEKDSKTADSFKLDDSAAGVDTYEELFTLMRIPVIEQVIFRKLEELKIIAKDEIKSFYEEPDLPLIDPDEEKGKNL